MSWWTLTAPANRAQPPTEQAVMNRVGSLVLLCNMEVQYERLRAKRIMTLGMCILPGNITLCALLHAGSYVL